MDNCRPTHLLRVEGVNMASTVTDTQDISTQRGASLMLLAAPNALLSHISGLQKVSVAASVGLYTIATDTIDAVLEQIAKYLCDDYPHLTFVVDAASLADGFEVAHQRVLAKNRFRQYTQPSLSTPRVEPTLPADGPVCCEFDRVRPRDDGNSINKRSPSHAVRQRREYGRDQHRRRFYEGELGDRASSLLNGRIGFTQDLEQIARRSPGRSFGNLDDKMAVLYFDGNGFGSVKEKCRSAAAIRCFDETVQDARRGFLADVVYAAATDSEQAFYLRDGNSLSLRLEVLTWGGDECLIIVPAWKGMETLQSFYRACARLTHDQERLGGEDDGSLGHAGGIVFCNHKTPITQVRKTAEDLANGVKRRLKKTYGKLYRRYDGFDYLVLESIEYPTEDLDSFRAIRYGPDAANRLYPLHPPRCESNEECRARSGAIADFLRILPRGSLYEVAQLWLDAQQGDDDGARMRAFRDRTERMLLVANRALDPHGSPKELYTKLRLYLFDDLVGVDETEDYDHAGWLHLAELWDYLAPESHEVAVQEGGA